MSTLTAILRPASWRVSTAAPLGRPLDDPGRFRRVLPFGAGALLGFAAIGLALPPTRPEAIAAAGWITIAILAISLLAPWDRLPGWLQTLPPVLYFGVVALLRHGEGGGSSGFSPLAMLPMVWLALYGLRWQVALGLAAAVVAFTVPILAIGAPDYPAAEWRRTVLWAMTAGLAAFAIQGLVMEVRRRAVDAEQHTAQLRRQELELRQVSEELARSNRDLESFASIAAHDLQEPMRKIQAFGERLRDGSAGALDERGQDHLARMMGASARMQTLIHDLLSYSRVAKHPYQFESVALGRVVQEVLHDLDRLVKETGARIEVGQLPVVQADPLHMRQLFQNLIGNALKYRRPDVPLRVAVSAEVLDDAWRIAVHDNGIGFDPTQAQRIFGPFQRLHGRDAYEGTGIGLAICQRIVERHGGTVQAEGRPGEGSTFTVTLPTAIARHAEAA